MSKYVVIFSIGPVQAFIASARRSRDLWSGSWLLSELAKACAKNLQEQGATLIFPFVQDKANLNKNSEFSVGNKIQVMIETESAETINEMIAKAKQATTARFEEEVNLAKSLLASYDNQIRQDIWQSQVKDYLEIQTAWARFDDGSQYGNTVQKAGRVLASRKSTRDFPQSCHNPYDNTFMLPKSSLDGMRETVLREDKAIKDGLRKKLSLSKSEQLDTVGVVKRLGFDTIAEQFTPFTRVTAHAWISEIAQQEPQDLERLKNTYNELVKQGIATRVTGNQGIYAEFPFDAQLLYPSRLEVALKEWQGIDDGIIDNLKILKDTLRPLFKQYGEPYRYGALLLADGDRMGELLDRATTQAEHQQITQALSNFAGQVSGVMRENNGHCIYAGGDDVLGFVPLDKAYNCANDLQKLFADSLKDVATNLKAEKSPTLSVGLAICHMMTPLSIIRELANQAEKHAKGDHINESQTKEQRRNALGILLSVRSGNDTKLRFNWSDEIGLDTFKKMISYYVEKSIPSRVAYDVQAIFLRTCDFAVSDDELQRNIQSAELLRMLKQARTDKGKKLEQNVIDGLIKRGRDIGLDKLAHELIVARWFASKTQRDLGKE